MTAPFGLWFGGSHSAYGTHLPILAAAALQSRGALLEFGLGFYSTPFLHALAEESGRELLSLEGDARWAENFEGLRARFHKIVAMPDGPDGADWTRAPDYYLVRPMWGVAFIDHNPEERRLVDAERLASAAQFVLVHDWEKDKPLYVEIADLFKYVWISRAGPQTAVLSNFQRFDPGGL